MAEKDNFKYHDNEYDLALSTRKSVSFLNSLSFWMNGVLSMTLVIVGMIGNTAVVVSFHCCNGARMRRRRRQAFYYYLMTFAVWNSGLLVATVLFNCLPTLLSNGETKDLNADTLHLSNVIYLIGYLLGNCCVTADVWLAVVVTVERYLAVSRPLQNRLTSPRRRAKLICTLLSVFAVCYNLPLLFELTFTTNDEPPSDEQSFEEIFYNVSRNSTWEENRIHKLCYSPMRDNVYYQFLYRVVANLIFVSIVPFLIVLLLTIKIVCVVRESNRKRAQFRKPSSSTETRPGQTALVSTNSISNSNSTPTSNSRHADIILTLIAAKFLLFYTLPVVINILELTTDPRTFESEESHAAKALLFLVDLSNLLVVVDGATNSFFYFSWRNRLRTYRQGGKSNQNSLGGLNLESRCGLSVAAVGGNEMPVVSRIRSGLDWPRQQEPESFLPQNLYLHRTWIPLRNIAVDDSGRNQ